jgi:hypothetical protein
MSESAFIGLDVHARSVSAALLDGTTGEVRNAAAPARTAELVEWLAAQGEALSVGLRGWAHRLRSGPGL